MFKEIPASNASLGMRGLVQKHGINDAPYKVHYVDPLGKRHTCPYYSVWSGMLERCYSEAFHKRRPTYKDCTIATEWHSFMKFKEWMELQDWEGKTIDKDMIVPGNKHYSPDTCLFVSQALNNLLTLKGKARGKYPLGVSKSNINGAEYYVASCSFYGTQKRLGYFKSIEEAEDIYKRAKKIYIKQLARDEENPKIKQTLLNMC